MFIERQGRALTLAAAAVAAMVQTAAACNSNDDECCFRMGSFEGETYAVEHYFDRSVPPMDSYLVLIAAKRYDCATYEEMKNGVSRWYTRSDFYGGFRTGFFKVKKEFMLQNNRPDN